MHACRHQSMTASSHPYHVRVLASVLLSAAENKGRFGGKQFSTVPPKTGKAPDAYLDKQVRSLALVRISCSISEAGARCLH